MLKRDEAPEIEGVKVPSDSTEDEDERIDEI